MQETRNDPLQFAIAGLGLIGLRHLEALSHVPDVRLSAVVEPAVAGQQKAADLQIDCFESLEALFADRRIDGVILATPTLLHMDQARTCLVHQCPVLVEKPIAVSGADAAPVVQQFAEAGLPMLVGHHRRYNPLIQRARDLIAAGEIGDIRAVQASCWLYKPDSYFDIAPWRKRHGAGPISVNLVHDIDLMRHLCGEIRVVQAMATPSLRGYENEDVASALLHFENGAIGTITVSDAIASPWSWELTARENPVYPPTQESCYLIGGSKGSLSLPDLCIWSHTGGVPDWWSPIAATHVPCEMTDPLVNQLEHFAEVIRGEAQPLVSGAEGLKSLRVIEAIEQAAASRDRVDLATDVS